MLVLKDKISSTELIIKPVGKLDVSTVDEFLSKVCNTLEDVSVLTLDFSEIIFVSSIGLRALCELQKAVNEKAGKMYLENVSSDVLDIFTLTGFNKILNIKQYKK